MNEVAEDWQDEARRRQRLSLIIGFASFVLGFGTSIVSSLQF